MVCPVSLCLPKIDDPSGNRLRRSMALGVNYPRAFGSGKNKYRSKRKAMCNTHLRYRVSAAPVCLRKRASLRFLWFSVLARVSLGICDKVRGARVECLQLRHSPSFALLVQTLGVGSLGLMCLRSCLADQIRSSGPGGPCARSRHFRSV